jgi:hypothetical protein
LGAVLADQAALMALLLAARAAAPSSLPVVAVVAVALPQLTPLKLAALAVSLAARPRALAAEQLLLRLTPARRLLRVLPQPLSRVVAARVAQETTPVRVPLAVLAASPAAVAVVAAAVRPRAALVARAAVAA